MKKLKIAVITCYHDPDYVRSRSLRAALAKVPDTEVIVIKNTRRGALRYPEVLWRLVWVRLKLHPAAYLLTFRGQEILPLVRLLTVGKTLWFDEFVVPKAYATKEAYRFTFKRALKKFLLRAYDPVYRFFLHRVSRILSDTMSHAETSAKLYQVNLRRYLAVPVGTDEKLFKPGAHKPTEDFQVFYYSTGMQPLHGVEYVLDAARELTAKPHIKFLLVGGKAKMAHAVKKAVEDGAHIEYRTWVQFDELPGLMRASGINLGGPFGGTDQAMHVITGKTFQSLAAAVPTLVGVNEETDRYFTDKVNALVVPQADAAQLAKKIIWASEHPKELAAIGAKGRKVFERNFSGAALAEVLETLVETLRIR